ncbi:TonB-dependent receptor [Sphingomonas sp. LHG3406-1]|uniref:TonB-dependent receptor n=1 Tax=Sphingomonas sp. LHG3406-1 TaxID=2804617 RepID=UPI0026084B41|nr:TonB-dependent receptor [Sphingomonas sp. LHG3406-1]
MKLRRLAVLLATSLIASPALAEETSGGAAAAQPSVAHGSEDHDHHDDEGDAIVVTAPFVRDLDLLAGKSVLSGDALSRDIRVQIGETLVRLPGVSATSFSPGASRPVLRGFQGERVRVLTDGLGSIDVSNTSADHAVTIDPLTAERIEVLRGPAALLFGGQAIGGAVNVIDRRIPRAQPRGGVHVDLLGGLGSAADERSIGGAVDVSLGDSGFVVHVDGSFRRTGDLRVGGHVLSPDLREEQRELVAEALEEGELEEAGDALELAELKGRLPNSATEQKTIAGGLAYIKGPLSLGVSVSRFETDYGVPTRPGAEHHHEEEEGEIVALAGEEHGEEAVSIGLKQTRYDLRGEYDVGGGFLDKVRLRLGAADYTHTEFEGDEVGTVFDSEGLEGRLEFVQADRNGWRGASGLQIFRRKFDAVGAEAFLRRNDSSSWGLFTLQELSLGKLGFEVAGRYDRSEIESKFFDLTRDYDAFSGALGVHYDVVRSGKIGLNLSRTIRAPSAEELFSDGPHVATSAYEIGNPDLKKEKALGAEVFFRVDRPDFTFNVAAYVTRFDDFIYEGETGEERDELPVFRYLQRDATYKGFEIEASKKIFESGGVSFVVDGVADYVRATLKGGGPVPRIPPLRLLGGIEVQSQRFDARAEVEWSDEQDRVTTFETRTDGHTLVNAALTWHPLGKRKETSVTLSANNIFDVDARRHASFTKDFVPLSGRDFRVAARFAF